MEEITVTIPRFIKSVILSEKKRTKYYYGIVMINNSILLKDTKKWFFKKIEPVFDNIHKIENLSDSLRFFVKNNKNKLIEVQKKDLHNLVDAKVVLADKDRNLMIVNPKTAGKPNLLRINFQLLYIGLHPAIRAKMLEQIKDSFIPYFSNLPVIQKYPIQLGLTFTDTVKGADLDNRSFLYVKALQDFLVNGRDSIPKILPNDTVDFINEINIRFVPCETEEERKLTISIKF